MKNKIISITIVFSFLACTLCAPAHIFLQSFCQNGLSFESVDIKGVSKNIILLAGKIAQFDDFTQNVKEPKSKVFDLSDTLALISKTEKQKFILQENPDKFNFQNYSDFSNTFYFTDTNRHRLRTHDNPGGRILFIFFILIYIGMLRAVYTKENILFLNIEKPLFA